MRGKPDKKERLISDEGITPAGAGKTRRTAADYTSNRDHPRRCGENSSIASSILYMEGSPPQVRGKRSSPSSFSPSMRITPAGAGKTQTVIHVCVDVRDHPRRCGENCYQPQRPPDSQGSPPQVRGKPLDSSFTASRDGITPAGAGKTFRLSPAKIAAEDHPRRCGENCA